MVWRKKYSSLVCTTIKKIPLIYSQKLKSFVFSCCLFLLNRWIPFLGDPAIDSCASDMLSERSTNWASTSPPNITSYRGSFDVAIMQIMHWKSPVVSLIVRVKRIPIRYSPFSNTPFPTLPCRLEYSRLSIPSGYTRMEVTNRPWGRISSRRISSC